MADNGISLTQENDELRSAARAHTGDLDVSASYPNGQCVANISKETTEKEVIKIKGIYGYTAKMQGINLSGGQTNSLEFCQTMFNLPNLNDLLVEFNKTL